jgi:hypothetical protein
MPSFQVPFSRRVIDPDPAGPIRTILRAALSLEVRTRGGWFQPMNRCIVDSGASYTMLSTARAKAIGLAVPDLKVHAPLLTATQSERVEVRDGEIVVRFSNMPGRIIRLYCLFVDGIPENTPLLLGLNDFFDTFRVSFDGRFSPEAPAGHMHFETD